MPDMSQFAQAKSDQINAADLMQPVTALITGVRAKGGDQPVDILLDNLKPWRPCKTMTRLMIAMWGKEGDDWVGNKITLYNDPSVKWGGNKVGGIRISHATGINGEFRKPLQSSRGKWTEYVVRTLSPDAPTFGNEPDRLSKVCDDLGLTPEDLDLWMNDMGKPKLSMAPRDARERVARWLATDAGSAKLAEWRGGGDEQPAAEEPEQHPDLPTMRTELAAMDSRLGRIGVEVRESVGVGVATKPDDGRLSEDTVRAWWSAAREAEAMLAADAGGAS